MKVYTWREREREMEYHTSENGFLEEILAFRNGDPYGASVPIGVDEFYNNGWNTSCFEDNNPIAFPSCNSFQDFSNMPFDQSLNCSFNELYHPFVDEYTAPEITTTATTDSSSNNKLDDSTPPAFLGQEEYSWSFMEDEEQLVLWGNGLHNLEVQAPSKVEPFQSNELAAFNMGLCPERKNSIIKKIDGQPSKNLMAERRRRKRLNDRLSMLRSVVPKISKMDRTSILGDTIDYVKELLERINKLQEEIEVKPNQVQYLPSIFKDAKPNEIVVRNSPKFDVERRNADTRIEISCAGKPGLLLSTVTTLEALGLEIQQCVISCFNDFALQASCSEELEARAIINSEDIKQALFRNAGYGGRCL